MRRQPVHQNAQFWLAMAGGWVLLVGVLGGVMAVEPLPVIPSPTSTSPTGLRVREAMAQPSSVIDRLQNAGNLQGQTGSGLQQPSTGDQLQPNAKTDSLGAPSN